MKIQLQRLLLAFALFGAALPVHAQGTAFTYQGRLTENGAPANGINDLTFTLYAAPSGGATVGTSNVVNDLAIGNGLFTITLDFGASAFDGNARWLQIAVRPGASTGAYTNLAPRQAVNVMVARFQKVWQPAWNEQLQKQAPWVNVIVYPVELRPDVARPDARPAS